MQKSYFHNKILLEESLEKTNVSQAKKIDKKKVVDINKLLNRVKVNKIYEKKRNIIFTLYTLLGLSLSAYIIFN